MENLIHIPVGEWQGQPQHDFNVPMEPLEAEIVGDRQRLHSALKENLGDHGPLLVRSNGSSSFRVHGQGVMRLIMFHNPETNRVQSSRPTPSCGKGSKVDVAFEDDGIAVVHLGAHTSMPLADQALRGELHAHINMTAAGAIFCMISQVNCEGSTRFFSTPLMKTGGKRFPKKTRPCEEGPNPRVIGIAVRPPEGPLSGGKSKKPKLPKELQVFGSHQHNYKADTFGTQKLPICELNLIIEKQAGEIFRLESWKRELETQVGFMNQEVAVLNGRLEDEQRRSREVDLRREFGI